MSGSAAQDAMPMETMDLRMTAGQKPPSWRCDAARRHEDQVQAYDLRPSPDLHPDLRDTAENGFRIITGGSPGGLAEGCARSGSF